MSIEVEVKSLLENMVHVEFVKKLNELLDVSLEDSESQLNHYFIDGSKIELLDALKICFNESNYQKIKQLFDSDGKLSIRTRQITQLDGFTQTLFIAKISLGDDSSQNGIVRREFEEAIPLSIDVLDELILSCGYKYQSKWSRSRDTYLANDITICVDKNAGYGLLVELEKVVNDQAQADAAKSEIYKLLSLLGLAELPQDRIERMFKYYNKNWEHYYGTENIFVIT